MNYTDTPLLSLARSKIVEYVRFMSQEIIGVYINETAHAATEIYGNEIADALFTQDQYLKKYNNPNELVVKQNHYNLMMHNRRRKIKIWLGVNARIAEANHQLAIKTWPEERILQNTHTFKGDGYYIESIPFIEGFTLYDAFIHSDSEFLHEIRNIHVICELVSKFVNDFYQPNKEGKITCCLDLIPDNVVITDDNSLLLIDFDHIVTVDKKEMIDKISQRFFKYVLDLDESQSHNWWTTYRQVNNADDIIATLRNKLT